eukprot:5097125-Prymnesium_polylepis.3
MHLDTVRSPPLYRGPLQLIKTRPMRLYPYLPPPRPALTCSLVCTTCSPGSADLVNTLLHQNEADVRLTSSQCAHPQPHCETER